MAYFHSPRIITDGLIAYLDAANPKSYPGSGTTWYDLTGNGYNGTLTNGPTFSSVNGGVIVLDGINDYINISLNLSTTNHTILGAARYVVASGRTFSGLNNNWLMGHWGTSTVKHYANGWVTDSVSNESSDTNWRTYASVGNYSSDQWTFYVNGSVDTGPNNGGANGPNGLSIGRYAPGNSEYSNSHISYLLAYNRLLSSTEILQNHNALKGRFGL
jgi:hypothetical protein